MNEKDKVSEEIYKEMLQNLDVPEIYDLCRKISEKFLPEDNEMYQYFHNNDFSEKEEN